MNAKTRRARTRARSEATRRRRRAADWRVERWWDETVVEAFEAVVEAVEGKELLKRPKLSLTPNGNPDEWDRGETVVSLDDLDLSFEPDAAFTEELADVLDATQWVVELPYHVQVWEPFVLLDSEALGGRYKTLDFERLGAEATSGGRALWICFWPVDSVDDEDEEAIAERAMALV